MAIRKPIHPKMLNHHKRFEYYKKQYNYSPKNILDIGALDGRWTICLSQIFDEANFLMVEANEEMKNILDKTGFNYIICALSDDVKEANYFLKLLQYLKNYLNLVFLLHLNIAFFFLKRFD